MKKTFEEMIGQEITGLKPDQVAYLARLAAYSVNASQVQKRIALFKDLFGEIDFKALKKMIQYSDLTENMIGGDMLEAKEVRQSGFALSLLPLL